MIDLNALQAAAEAAGTEHPWHWHADPVKGDPLGRSRYEIVTVGRTITRTHYTDDTALNEAKFIAAANPAIILELIDRLRKAEAASKWMPIETAPKGKSIVVGYFNRKGKWRVVRAEYATAETIAEYWENDDCEPGWYESSEEQETIYKLEYEPSHWHPLDDAPPTAPADADTEGGK